MPGLAARPLLMNATFDRQTASRRLDLLKKGRTPTAQWLRVNACGDHLIFEAGAGTVSLPALVLEPGAFTTRRMPFQRVLGSFTGQDSLTLQADAGRFRIGAFSGQLLDYVADPAAPKGFEPSGPSS